jgi:hypothetical protein
MKELFPRKCPACNQPLVIEVGEKSDTLKLMCKNKKCSGSLLKRLQKGIIALEIRGLGPKVIENLMGAGINSSLDLFDAEIFNEQNLIVPVDCELVDSGPGSLIIALLALILKLTLCVIDFGFFVSDIIVPPIVCYRLLYHKKHRL